MSSEDLSQEEKDAYNAYAQNILDNCVNNVDERLYF